MLLNRRHHNRPVSGPFGSLQRTARRNRSLKNDEEVLETLKRLDLYAVDTGVAGSSEGSRVNLGTYGIITHGPEPSQVVLTIR